MVLATIKNNKKTIFPYQPTGVGDYVEVTTDGVKNVGAMLNELFAVVDFSKVNGRSTLEIGGTSVAEIATMTETEIWFTRNSLTSNNTSLAFQTWIVKSSGSKQYYAMVNSSGTAVSDITTNVPPSGAKYRFCYNRALPIVEQTTNIKTDTFSGTTTSLGQLALYTGVDRVPLAIKFTSLGSANGGFVDAVVSGGNTYIVAQMVGGTIASQTISGIYYYVEL